MPGTEAPLSVFVSSTVDDFRDLRSAVKVWFEELGFEVHMSEYADFGRPIESDTIQSCLEVIARCDYFVLFIGGRRGSAFGEDSSVTREEFRCAVELARQGKIKIIVFVRDEVMTALYERRELKRMFERGEVLGADVAQETADIIDQTKSRTLEDPDFVRSFVDEVRHTPFGESATGPGAGSLWTYRFKGFDDIVTALRTTMPVRRSLRRQALLANLDWELLEILRKFLSRTRGGAPYTPGDWISALRAKVTLGEIDLEQPHALSGEDCSHLAVFTFLSASDLEGLEAIALKEAIHSGEFLRFDQDANRLIPGDVLKALYQLAREIERAKGLRNAQSQPPFAGDIELIQASAQLRQPALVRMITIGHLFGLADAIQNTMRLATALHRYIQTGEFRQPDLHPSSPFKGANERIAEEEVSPERLRGWLEHMLPRQELTGVEEPELTQFTKAAQDDLWHLAVHHPEWTSLVVDRYGAQLGRAAMEEAFPDRQDADG